LLVLLAPMLALLPLAAYGLVAHLGMRQAEVHHDGRRVARVAENLSLAIEGELAAGLRALETLAGSAVLERRDLPAFREEARRLLARETAWHTIALVDGSRQVMNLRFAPDQALPAFDQPVGRLLAGARPAAVALQDGRILLGAAVQRDGAVRAALVAVLEGAVLAGPIARVRIPHGWSAVLLDEDGHLLAGVLGAAIPLDALTPALATPGQTRALAAGGQALARPLAETRWSVVVAIPPSPPALDWLWFAVALLFSMLLGGAGMLIAASGERQRQALARRDGAAEAAASASVQDRRRSDLMATVSHELRAPLTGLLGYTDLLLRAGLPAQPRGWVEQQKRAGEVLLALIGDVLDFARLDEGAIALEDTDIDLPAFLEEAAGMMQALAAQKGLRLNVVGDRALPRWVKGDPLRLRQVVTNLLSNALKFTAAGEVTLAACPVAGPDRIEISVTDTGMGIPAEELPRIFDRFRQAGADTARRFGGSGLGLAICQRLARAMGGTLTAESRPGEGSRFVLRIPFRPGAAPAAARADAALSLLIAEDVPASRLLLQALLERAGHKVTAVEDGAQALAALHGARFDLALLDLQMPGIDGMGVAAAIRRMPGKPGRLPLVALTADPPEEVESRCRTAGFDAVLRKPFETRRLLGLIEALRNRRADDARPVAAAAD
jgi:signal transduction histidine kinase